MRRNFGKEALGALFTVAMLLLAWFLAAAGANDPACVSPEFLGAPEWLVRPLLLCDVV